LVVDEQDPVAGEVMYWLAAVARGRGLAVQAVQLICEWAFAVLGLERITLRTYAGNLRSQRVAARAGFLRINDTQVDDTLPTKVWYSRTRAAP
jgi:RimJ/RimL family protein N-acetyltransferase